MSDSITRKKQIFVVLGMARSGTSVISRSLKSLNICHGPSLIGARDQWNPRGFWEDKEIVFGIHRKIFSKLHREPYELQSISTEDQAPDKLGDISAAAMKLISNRFVNTNRYGFKDPATSRLLPFWRSIFQLMHVEDHYIISLRHPFAAARSYQKLLGYELEASLLLWCTHTVQSVENTHGLKRVVIDYNLMLQKPRHQIERMASAFQLGAINEAESSSFVKDFIGPKFDRFNAGNRDVCATEANNVAVLSTDIYDLLLQAANDTLDVSSPAFTQQWQQLMHRYTELYPMYCFIDRLMLRRKKLRKTLRNIHKSWVWKLLAPLRWVDDALRQRRRKKHLKNRAVTQHA